MFILKFTFSSNLSKVLRNRRLCTETEAKSNLVMRFQNLAMSRSFFLLKKKDNLLDGLIRLYYFEMLISYE